MQERRAVKAPCLAEFDNVANFVAANSPAPQAFDLELLSNIFQAVFLIIWFRGSVTMSDLLDLRFFGMPIRDLSNIQLDIAGFLGILGEGSVLANSQVASLSRIVFLPRLLPAPQALMTPTRPSKLEPAVGYTTGVESGNHRDYINHVGHVLVQVPKETIPLLFY